MATSKPLTTPPPSWRRYVDLATFSISIIAASGLNMYRKSGLDPIYLGFALLICIYFALGVMASIVELGRGIVIFCGMLLLMRAWRNWRDGTTDVALLDQVLEAMGADTSGHTRTLSSVPEELVGINVVKGEIGVFVRSSGMEETHDKGGSNENENQS